MKGLGRGGRARAFYARRGMDVKYYTYTPYKARRPWKRTRSGVPFVPRTMGPFSVSESKYFDAEESGFAVAENTGAWAATNDIIKGIICVPVEGSDINNRVGRKIAVYKVACRGIINPASLSDQADVLSAPAWRVILWMDTQCNGSETTSAALMEAGTANTAAVTFTAFQNIANFGRFRVLKDKVIRSGGAVASTDGANTSSIAIPNIPFKITHKFSKPCVVKFGASAGAIGDIVNNAFYISIQASTVNYTSTVTVRTRAYYKDN